MTRLVACIAALAAASPAATALAAPKPPPAPTIASAPAIVGFGASTTLSGKVPGAKPGSTVALQRDPFPLGDGWLPYRTATVGKGGAFSVSVPPFIATTYRVVAGGAASPGAQVRVRPSVGFSVGRSGALVRFSGSVRPARDGARVAIQRRTPSGAWTTVRRATLTDAGSSRSSYSARLRVGRAGTYRVKLAAGSGYLTGTSRERAVTAR